MRRILPQPGAGSAGARQSPGAPRRAGAAAQARRTPAPRRPRRRRAPPMTASPGGAVPRAEAPTVPVRSSWGGASGRPFRLPAPQLLLAVAQFDLGLGEAPLHVADGILQLSQLRIRRLHRAKPA